MKALVTGGAGFIGSHVVDALIENGSEVIVLKSGFRSNSHPNFVNSKAKVLEGNLLDPYSLVKATKDIDYVFHCGAMLSHWAEKFPELTFDVNVKGTWLLKEACQHNGVARIIFASTSFVYGDPASVPVHEDSPLNPKGNFEVSKLAAEKILQAVHPFQVPYTILRLFNVYGPRSDPDGVYSSAITTFILKALKKESIEVHGDGTQTLDFVYVKDVAEAFLQATVQEAENQIYNIGSGTSTKVIQLAEMINTLTRNPVGVHFNGAHPAYLKTIRADTHRAYQDLGWYASTELTDGLVDTYRYFQRAKL